MVQNKKNENQTEVMAGEQSVCFWTMLNIRGRRARWKSEGQKWPYVSRPFFWAPMPDKALMITTSALAFLITQPGLTEEHKAGECGGAHGTKTGRFHRKAEPLNPAANAAPAAPVTHYYYCYCCGCCWRGGDTGGKDKWCSHTGPPACFTQLTSRSTDHEWGRS